MPGRLVLKLTRRVLPRAQAKVRSKMLRGSGHQSTPLEGEEQDSQPESKGQKES
jgi:hypothetical protein